MYDLQFSKQKIKFDTKGKPSKWMVSMREISIHLDMFVEVRYDLPA
jgi:hypothetical protein